MSVEVKQSVNFLPSDHLLLIDTNGILLMQKYFDTEEIKTLGYVSEKEFLDQLPRNIKTPILPKNCISYKSDNNNDFTLAIVTEPQTVVMDIESEGIYNVKLPHLLWIFKISIRGGQFVDKGVQCFALKNWPTNGDQEVFEAPLPNCYYTNGEICFGTVTKKYNQDDLNSYCYDIINTILSTKYSMHYRWRCKLTIREWQDSKLSSKDLFDALLIQNTYGYGTLENALSK